MKSLAQVTYTGMALESSHNRLIRDATNALAEYDASAVTVAEYFEETTVTIVTATEGERVFKSRYHLGAIYDALARAISWTVCLDAPTSSLNALGNPRGYARLIELWVELAAVVADYESVQ